MMSRKFANALKTADFQIPVRYAVVGALAIAMTLFAVFAMQIALAENLVTPAGAPMGGDYAAFWTAANAMAAGDAAAIYDPAAFKQWLFEIGPPRDDWGLTWQYPPTYFLVIGFLAFVPYAAGYALWTGGGLALFAASARQAGLRGETLVIMLAAPAVFQAVITGQNGFLTATLLLGATLLADKRPVLAGLCAALMTIKPQLGLLLPIAYLAGGHWRAFGVAAAGAIALAGASIAAFGFAPWAAFFESLIGVSGNVSSGAMPLYKMPTFYAAFFMAGFPPAIAIALHAVGAAAAMWATALIWRRSDNPALKAAIVCCGAFLVAPYAYYYELVIMAAPIALLALQSAKDGWRPFDHLVLAALFIAPLFMPGDSGREGFNIAFPVTVLAVVFILRFYRLGDQKVRRDFIAAASVPSSR
ncbi:MAG: glycosyltransferase family 87 protein [Pseudomonadota bacterium]